MSLLKDHALVEATEDGIYITAFVDSFIDGSKGAAYLYT
jgi:hypothetical protein